MAASSSSLDLIVKFGKRALSLSLSTDETIGTLKATLEDLTSVDAQRQKLIGVPASAEDGTRLAELCVRA
jgi:hypothetical protein